ncbi:GIY-YIG nuclease family protein [bacterium]|nr:GIY-YIG nuclease family protein [bacterium]
MSYFTYILQSGLDQSFYIGYTANIKKRLEEHNNGESRYTKRKIPWKLVHLETFNLKRDAIIREKELKKIRNTRYLKKIIHNK